MPASNTDVPGTTLALSGEEREFLLRVLEQRFHDKQIEEHRTEAFDFRERVRHEEALLQGLIDKLRGGNT
jgi:hypothetical protein